MPVPQRLHAQWLALQPSRVAKDSMGQCMPKDAGPPEPGADDGTIEAAITGEEVLRLREIFNKIADEESSDGQKALSVHELLHMAALLGEPHTEAEAGEAIEHFHEADEKLILFDEFLSWWKYEHATDSGKRKHRGHHYSARFKLNIEELHSPFDLSRLSFETTGEVDTLSWRMYFMLKDEADGVARRISAWHQIPLWADGRGGKHELGAAVHFVCEIPQMTRKKFEIATVEVDNPIHQDVKNGMLREYKYADMPHNYGALPQTWEDPDIIDEATGLGGDNDPLDAIEISGERMDCGAVKRVRVLGALAMIDDGETDWKVVVVAEGTELHDLCNNCDDVEKHRPGLLNTFREWMRVYKTAEGKPENSFGNDEQYTSAEWTQTDLIPGTHDMWADLMRKGIKTS